MNALQRLYATLTENRPAPVRALVTILFLPVFLIRFLFILNDFLKTTSDVHMMERAELDARLVLDIRDPDPLWAEAEAHGEAALKLIDKG
ncbi:MAG: hypothetical protein AAFY59_20310, partial [Pseudomonadota bacterium]